MNKFLLAAVSFALLASGQAEAGFSKHKKAFCPPPVCQPVPKKKTWVPGHYEVQIKQIWQPGHFQEVWVDPVYAEYAYFGNCTVKILVDPGCYKKVWVEGCFKTERCKVWVPGKWVVC